MVINITSIDSGLLLRLRKEKLITYEVHSRFSKALNLIDQHGSMISLLANKVANGPFTALVNIPDFSVLSKSIDVGQQLLYHKGLLVNGDIKFTFLNVPLIWDGEFFPISRALRPEEILLIDQLLMTQKKFTNPLNPKIDAVQLHISQKLRENLEGVTQAFFNKNLLLAKKHIQALIGLGQGLTPSGDDHLLGLMFVLYLYKNYFQDEIYLIQKMIDTSQDKTHDISWWMLHHGSLGKFNEWLLDYGNLLTQPFGKDSLLQEKACLLKVLSIGSQSGGDMVSGILAGLKLVKLVNIEMSFK